MVNPEWPPTRPSGSSHVRKLSMQLASKMRFVSAQLIALYGTDLWLRSATHANAMATRLAAGVEPLAGVTVQRPVQANAVFAVLAATSRTRCASGSASTSGTRPPARCAGCAPGTRRRPTSTPSSRSWDGSSAPRVPQRQGPYLVEPATTGAWLTERRQAGAVGEAQVGLTLSTDRRRTVTGSVVETVRRGRHDPTFWPSRQSAGSRTAAVGEAEGVDGAQDLVANVAYARVGQRQPDLLGRSMTKTERTP